MTIEEMKAVDIRTVDPKTLVDVTTIKIDENLSKEERVAEFLRQVKNPYCFSVGDVVVKNVYSTDGVTLVFQALYKVLLRSFHCLSDHDCLFPASLVRIPFSNWHTDLSQKGRYKCLDSGHSIVH